MLIQASSKYQPFRPIPFVHRKWPDAVLKQPPIWLSTDLRDGNQALIEPMDMARKLRLFKQLLQIGFKQIEIGFPAASQVEFDFVRHLIDADLIPDDVTIQVMTPAREPLIRRTITSVVGARRVILHLYNAISPLMRTVVLGMDESQTIELATSHAQLIRDLAQHQPATDWTFQYSPEHFSGTELDFSKRVVDAVTAVWQPTTEHKCIINLPATVENSTPNVFADMIEWMHCNIENRDAVVLSVHPHNDRGTGVASGELALMAGAQRVEGCLFGNGERTGNVDLVNLALNLYSQGVSPGLDFSNIDEVRRTAEHCNQMPVHPRHPYVGELVYTSFSGTHQDAIKKAFAARSDEDVWAIPYLPLDPKDLGRSYEAVIRINSQSGKGGMSYLLESEYGLELPRRLQIEFSQVVKAVMDDEGKELSAKDLRRLFEREYGLSSTTAVQFEEKVSAAGVALTARFDLDGNPQLIQGLGVGPVEAFINGLNASLGFSIRVLDYHEHALGTGADAQAAAYLELRIDEQRTVFGVGIDVNIVSASLKAIISGLHRAQAQGENAALADSVAA
jgi:2-isopropylmalate synthase